MLPVTGHSSLQRPPLAGPNGSWENLYNDGLDEGLHMNGIGIGIKRTSIRVAKIICPSTYERDLTRAGGGLHLNG